MNEKSIKCPSCDQPASGSFCSHCGASLTNQAAPTQRNIQAIVSWAAMGISIVALVVSIVVSISVFFVQKESATSALTETKTQAPLTAFSLGSSPTASPAPQGNQLPDLSTMTPRQAADRLFNRVMMAVESGNTQEAKQFSPMAVSAYMNLPERDNDALYHLALIHMAAGDLKSTRTQLDMLQRAVPNHLLGLIVEYQLAKKSGKDAIKYYKRFLSAYDSEILVDRVEYKDHQNNIDGFRKRALAAVAEKK